VTAKRTKPEVGDRVVIRKAGGLDGHEGVVLKVGLLVTIQTDNFRDHWGHSIVKVPRRCVVVQPRQEPQP
jgi:hypothetical protein